VSFRNDHPPPPPPPQAQRKPAVDLPRTVAVLIGINVAIYLIGAVLPYRWEGWLLYNFGFVPESWAVPEGLPWQALVGPISHQFLHAGALHLIVNMIMLAAFGSGVERVLGGRRLLALYLVAGVAGAACHWAFYPLSGTPVVGASGAISGLFGGVLRLMAKQAAGTGKAVGIWPVAAIWIGIAVLTGFTGTPGAGEAQVAWAAHVGGFLLGFLAIDLFAIGAPRARSPRRRPPYLRDLDDER
jgi:membrane associated rhomboid family serine protease